MAVLHHRSAPIFIVASGIRRVVSLSGSLTTVVLVVLSLLYLAHLPRLSRATYISENAWSVHMADPVVAAGLADHAVGLARSMAASGCETGGLLRAMRGSDIPARGHGDGNVEGRVVARKTDGGEAFVVAARYSGAGGRCSPGSLAVAIAVASVLARQNYLQKDVIVLAYRDERGLREWLDDYHSGSFKVRPGGAIRAAVNLALVGSPGARGHILGQGFNGQLVNLDVINVLAAIEHFVTGEAPLVHAAGREPSSLADGFLMFIAQLAAGRASGPHGHFLRYAVPAVTYSRSADLEAPEMDLAGGSDEVRQAAYEMAMVLEAFHRAANNLSEAVHQSFFNYLLAGPYRYVSIGDYLPSMGLLLLAMACRTYYVRFTVPAGDRAARAAITAFLAVVAGAAVLLAARALAPPAPAWAGLSLVFLAAFWAAWPRLVAALDQWSPRVSGAAAAETRADHWETLLGFSLAYACMAVAIFTLINFSFGLVASAGVSALVLGLHPGRARWPQHLLVLATSPPAAVALAGLALGFKDPLQATKALLATSAEYESLALPFFCLVHIPIWLMTTKCHFVSL
jgi:hypothetical protein